MLLGNVGMTKVELGKWNFFKSWGQNPEKWACRVMSSYLGFKGGVQTFLPLTPKLPRAHRGLEATFGACLANLAAVAAAFRHTKHSRYNVATGFKQGIPARVLIFNKALHIAFQPKPDDTTVVVDCSLARVCIQLFCKG